MKKMKTSKPPQLSRTVKYFFQVQPNDGRAFSESTVEKLLNDAVFTGVVIPGEFDTGRGHAVWFVGRPGKKLRELRDKIKTIVEEAK